MYVHNLQQLEAKKLSQEYDVIIVELGIWEYVRPWACRDNMTWACAKAQWEDIKGDVQLRLLSSLDTLSQMASSNLKIFYRTLGPVGAKDSQNTQAISEFNKHVLQWFAENKPRRMFLHDWAKQIWPRSFGDNRIEGDSKAHWGLARRTDFECSNANTRTGDEPDLMSHSATRKQVTATI